MWVCDLQWLFESETSRFLSVTVLGVDQPSSLCKNHHPYAGKPTSGGVDWPGQVDINF